MEKSEVILDNLIIEIRYSFGHLYWDRCGQTISDIETQCDGWFAVRDEKNIGRLENPERKMILTFNDMSLNFSIKKPKKSDEDLFAEEVQKIWKIIRANFGLEEFDRLGCRLHFLRPTKSTDESENLMKKSDLNITVPSYLDYNLILRHLIGIFKKDDFEYRVELRGVTRSEGIDPTNLFHGRPEAMSKNQKKYRMLKIKQLAEYSANPMYAVMLDIDCVKYEPEQVQLGEFFKKQIDLVRKDFLSILEKL
jgi:hypothetical protein